MRKNIKFLYESFKQFIYDMRNPNLLPLLETITYNNVENSKILTSNINNTIRKEFIIPTAGLSASNSEQELVGIITDYTDHVSFDDTTGEIYIDGSKELP